MLGLDGALPLAARRAEIAMRAQAVAASASVPPSPSPSTGQHPKLASTAQEAAVRHRPKLNLISAPPHRINLLPAPRRSPVSTSPLHRQILTALVTPSCSCVLNLSHDSFHSIPGWLLSCCSCVLFLAPSLHPDCSPPLILLFCRLPGKLLASLSLFLSRSNTPNPRSFLHHPP